MATSSLVWVRMVMVERLEFLKEVRVVHSRSEIQRHPKPPSRDIFSCLLGISGPLKDSFFAFTYSMHSERTQCPMSAHLLTDTVSR